MKNLSVLILSSLLASGAFAAAHTGAAPMTPGASSTMPEAQKPGSPKAQAAAEDKHNAKSHGTDKSAKQPEAQTPGSAKAQDTSERKHNAKSHGTDKSAKQPEAQTPGSVKAQDAKKL